MLLGILVSGIWFCAFLAAQLVAFHLQPQKDRSKTLIQLFGFAVLAHLMCVAGLALLYPESMILLGSTGVLSALAGLMNLACLFILYMPFYYTLNTSLSVETLALVLSHGGRMPIDRVVHRFTSPEFIHDRLETMRRNGYLKSSDRVEYFLSKRGTSVGAKMARVKRWLVLGTGG